MKNVFYLGSSKKQISASSVLFDAARMVNGKLMIEENNIRASG